MTLFAGPGKKYEYAVKLYEKGMYERACTEFDRLSQEQEDVMVEGYKVLCAIGMQTRSFEMECHNYERDYPFSPLIKEIRYRQALVLFDAMRYDEAGKLFAAIPASSVSRSDKAEYLYKKAYCDYALGNYSRAEKGFENVISLNSASYRGPARFALGYINYSNKKFATALDYFEKSAGDPRFTDLSSYYSIDCSFMLKDYERVVASGEKILPSLDNDKAVHVARMVAESYLVLGESVKAKSVYDKVLSSQKSDKRDDLFFAASVMYAVQDWSAAIEKYKSIEDRTDSIGQIASYNMGYCYIKTKNKVEAMNAFRDASRLEFDKSISEDALFNYAKLAFDLNSDSSVFHEYMNKYPVRDNNDRIYSYIAVAALRNRDYAAAVDAFDKIDELDETMKRNYMKSNYLRASQLMADESYKDAVPYLKAAAYYARKNSPFHQLSRYFLAESYYRSEQYAEALSVYNDLYNNSALEGMVESSLIPYNIAYCYFKQEDFTTASKWFEVYLATGETNYRKGAMLRKADCSYMKKNYEAAIQDYEKVSQTYPNVNDIYPYYQAAICYGLAGLTETKLSTLLPVRQAEPSSKYYSEALYELGRTYVRLNRDSEAESCFRSLVDNSVDSLYFAKSAIELGMICSNNRQYDEALSWYKMVVSRMPLSAVADDALVAMESVYQQRNQPQAYLDYLASVGRSNLKSESEKELMFFNSAEQLYLSGDYSAALVALKDYLQRWPSGSCLSNVYFYMAECYKGKGQKELACDYYSKVVEMGSESYSELAMMNFANLSFSLQRYDNAYGAYSMLNAEAKMEANRYQSLLGMMRSAYNARRFADAIESSDAVMADVRSEKDILREANYIKAKSCLQTSQRPEAFRIFKELSKQTNTSEGAEANYLLIQDAYDRGEFSQATEMVFSFSENSDGTQQYWLARSFIVLGDCYVEKGEKVQAEATFRSVKDGYDVEDDGIIDEVNMRLSKLKNL